MGEPRAWLGGRVTTPLPYADLPEDAQVEALRPVALAAAEAFGLDVHRMEVVRHAYNTTFAVDDAAGTRVALRVGTNSKSTAAHIDAQQAWVHAIGHETDVSVPDPLRTTSGSWWVAVPSEALRRDVLVTGASWLGGADAKEGDDSWARRLGRVTAVLHEHGRSWRLPEGTVLDRFDTPLLGDADVLDDAPGLTADEHAVLQQAREVTEDAFARLHDGATLFPVHADLHAGNLKWHDGRLSVFDFDDCGLGLPVLDLGISAFYLRDGRESTEAELRAGYAEVAPLPDVDPADAEAVVAARQLLLANSLLESSTAELRALADGYAHTAVARLRHWLETGRFTLDPAPL